MGLICKGSIKYDPERDGSSYVLTCKQLDIICDGSGDIKGMMEDLTAEVAQSIEAEFSIEPELVKIVGYSMNITFDVKGPINRSLDEFERASIIDKSIDAVNAGALNTKDYTVTASKSRV
jgi:hypothetical protein